MDPAAITFHIAFAQSSFWIDHVQWYEGDYVETVIGPRVKARSPYPADGATDVRYDAKPSWEAGDSAAAHDVYFGMNFDDVNEASRTDDRGVLVSMGQSETTYDPGMRLALNQTYHWRVDEVNAPPDSTIFPGDVWSFTIEPVSYDITGVTATASSSHAAGTGPENTVNGSGLNADGSHSQQSTDMWLSSATDPGPWWIQYNLGQAYTLHEMRVWNSNQAIEPLLGFGVNGVVVEYSLDGENWTTLEGVTNFNQATGQPDYQANTTVAFNSAIAQYVRITALSNFGGVIPQVSLSEVQFSNIPTAAREPVPADGATVSGIDVTLGWRPGREAAQHEVVFSGDQGSVADGSALVATVDETTYSLDTLDLGSGYFWRINEVNEAGANPRYEGNVWKFKTPEELKIDDMEMYADEEFLEIWAFWVDGFEDNNNGSLVGTGSNGNEAEKGIVYEGRQSLPMAYDNTNAAISEATRTFDPALDLNAGNPDTLSVHLNGLPPDFVEDADGNMTVGAGGADIWNTADEFRFVYKRLSGNGSITAKINSVQEADAWTKAGVMIRESLAPESANAYSFVTPNGRVGTQWRESPFASTTSTRSQNAGDITLPFWVRLTRTGDTLKGERSADGVSWGPMIRQDIPDDPTEKDVSMIPDVFIGLALTSHNVNASTVAMFSDVSTTGNVSGAWTAEAIGVDQPSNSADAIYMVLTDSSGKQQTLDHPNPAATLITAWEAWMVPYSDLTVNMGSIRSITLGVGTPGGAASSATGTVYFDNLRVLKPYAPHYDLVAEYKLDGDVLDSTGNGYDGVISGDPNFIDGVAGQGLEFDGTGEDYVTIGTVDPSFFSGQLSVSLFAKWNGLSGNWQGLIGKRDNWAAADMMWQIEANQDTGTISFAREGVGFDNGGKVLPEGEWEHVGATFDGSTGTFFIGGEVVGSGAFSLGTGSGATLVFGCCQRNGGNPFNGALDEIRIYDRAISEQEMMDLATQ